MEALVRVMDAGDLPPVFDIPAEMRRERVRVVVTPVEEAGAKPLKWLEEAEIPPGVNKEILLKFQAAARAGVFKEHLRKKLAEGFTFDFDAQKIIDGTETEEDRQRRYRMEKRAWVEAVAERGGR